jgi:hypothetical protein
MKKIVFTAFIIFLSFISKAQITKNQWLLGGDLGFQYNTGDVSTKTTFNISPTIGYFFHDKFAAGLQTNFSKIADGLHSNSLGPFLRYYFLPVNQKVNVFGDAAYLYSWTESSNANGYHIKAGPAFFVSPSVALEFTVGYFHAKVAKSSYKTDQIRTGIGFKVHLGKGRQATTNRNSG